MTIYNLGSINADFFYQVPHLPKPGETLAATEMASGLGGKGANMSVAAARAGAQVVHIGAIGNDGVWAKDRLTAYGVDTQHVAIVDTSTAQAVVSVDAQGENSIILWPGANLAIQKSVVTEALCEATEGDILLMQNETELQCFAADIARTNGMKIAYAAAPFCADAVQEILPYVDFLILNQVEAAQLMAATGKLVTRLGVEDVVVTLGSRGSRWNNHTHQTNQFFEAPKVDVVDTTGAGDTYTGYALALIDTGHTMATALNIAADAAALMVTRHGTADAIPTRNDVVQFSENLSR
ncbi:ribokinase [Shimia litoralis]|uniref:Ribokinase n=1 Tax=Shimia litoralis TaxID=420403 RepID=A0A4U7MVT4_9RHOB|nr:ribokinase [Shimia litoralis]TKZ17260.1 ribokinase [Shimia litoralis]